MKPALFLLLCWLSPEETMLKSSHMNWYWTGQQGFPPSLLEPSGSKYQWQDSKPLLLLAVMQKLHTTECSSLRSWSLAALAKVHVWHMTEIRIHHSCQLSACQLWDSTPPLVSLPPPARAVHQLEPICRQCTRADMGTQLPQPAHYLPVMSHWACCPGQGQVIWSLGPPCSAF